MPDADVADKITRGIVGRTLIGVVALSAKMRREISSIMRQWFEGDLDNWDQPVREILADGGELLLAQLDYTDLISWIAAFDLWEGELPRMVSELLSAPQPEPGQIIVPGAAQPPPQRPIIGAPDSPDEPEPIVRFPKLEAAARSLERRGILTRPDFDKLTTVEREGEFTVAYIEEETIKRIRDVLVEDINEGTSFAGFRERIDETLGGSPIGPGHLETVYRTNTQASFRDGRETIARNDIVAELFPFARYDAIRDDRVRPEHLALETLGLDGTGVYWASDPVWDFHTPPWDYNCRCAKTLVTVEQAAALGVSAAREWIRTGTRPDPEYRLDAVRAAGIMENPGWGSRGRVAV